MPDQPPPSPEALARYAEEFSASATMRHFGVKLDFPDGKLTRATLPIRPEHRGGLGSSAVNGGILAAMFDLVIGASPALIDPTRRSATIQISMSFEQPVDGDTLYAEAWIDRAGGTTVFASAHIRDATGLVCARAQGVVRFSRTPWASGSSPAVN